MDKNYALENNLVESKRRMTALIEQNRLLHDQLTASKQVERVSEVAAEDQMEESEEEGQDSVSSRAGYDKKRQQTIARETELAHHAKSGFSSTMQQCTISPLQERELGPTGSGEEPE